MNKHAPMPKGNQGGGPMPHGKPKLNAKVLKRLIGMLFAFYPVLLPISIGCIIFSAVASAIPAVFLEQVTTAIDQCLKNATLRNYALHCIK